MRKRLLVLPMLVLGLAGPLLAGDVEECVFARTVSNWRAIDDERLVVWADGAADRYLLVLATPSFNLGMATSVGFSDGNQDGRLCSYGGDAVLIGGTIGERRIIRSLRRLDEAEYKALLQRKP